MSKRTQEDAGERRVTAKSKPMMNLVSRCSVRNPNVLASTASESPELANQTTQNGRSSAKEAEPILDRCNTRQQQTFFNMENVYVFNIGSICIFGEELLRQFTLNQKNREESHDETDV